MKHHADYAQELKDMKAIRAVFVARFGQSVGHVRNYHLLMQDRNGAYQAFMAYVPQDTKNDIFGRYRVQEIKKMCQKIFADLWHLGQRVK